MHLQLGIGGVLEALRQHQVEPVGRKAGEQLLQVRIGAPHPVFHLQGPARGGRQQGLLGAGLAQLEAVLTRLIQVETVVGVFEIADPQPPGLEQRDQLPQQGGLAAATGGDEADDWDLAYGHEGSSWWCFP